MVRFDLVGLDVVGQPVVGFDVVRRELADAGWAQRDLRLGVGDLADGVSGRA